MVTNSTAAVPELQHIEVSGYPLIISDEGVGDLLGVSRSHFRNMVRKGMAPAPIKLGRSARWRTAELVDWVNAGMPPRHRWNWKAGRS